MNSRGHAWSLLAPVTLGPGWEGPETCAGDAWAFNLCRTWSHRAGDLTARTALTSFCGDHRPSSQAPGADCAAAGGSGRPAPSPRALRALLTRLRCSPARRGTGRCAGRSWLRGGTGTAAGSPCRGCRARRAPRSASRGSRPHTRRRP